MNENVYFPLTQDVDMDSLLSRAKQVYIKNGPVELLRAGRDWLYSKCKSIIKTQIYGLPLIDDWCYQKSSGRLQERMENEEEFRDAIETVHEYQGYGNYKSIKPMQGIKPLEQLLDNVAEIEPETVVEIGTARGGTFYLMVRFLKSADKFVSVNLGWSFGYKYKKKLLEKIDPDKRLSFIVGDSHDKSTYERVRQATDSEVDFIFIDGDHSYDGVKQDFEMYKDLVCEGGIIAFHDIQHQHSRVGVDEFWREIKTEYETKEIGISPERTTGGIGLVFV